MEPVDTIESPGKGIDAKSFLSSFSMLSASTLFMQLSKMAAVVLAAKLLGPVKIGLWNMLNLMLVYSGLTHLGILNGMNREIPFFRGRAETGKVERIRSNSLGFSILGAFASSFLILAASMAFEDPLVRKSLTIMIFMLFFQQIYSYAVAHMASDCVFGGLAAMQALLGFFTLALVMPGTYRYGFQGFLVSQALAFGLSAAAGIHLGRVSLRVSLDAGEIKSLLSTGFPLMSAGLMFSLLTTVDRWVISVFLGIEAVGWYTLPILIAAALALPVQVISRQMYPKMAEEFGRTGSRVGLLSTVKVQNILGIIAVAPLAAAIWAAGPWLVGKFIPAFLPGMEAGLILLIGLLSYPFAGGFGTFLVSIRKQNHYLAVQAAGVVVNLALSVLFVKMGFGIRGIAMGTAATHLAVTCSLYGLTRRFSTEPSQCPASS